MDKDRILAENANLKAEVERLQSIHSIDSIGIEQLKAEVERLKEGNECLDQMHEKEMARSAFLCEEVNRTTAWGRGLESNLSWARAELLMVKAEVERLTSDIQMEKENEDRLVREWQKANNEVYGLQRQVAALIDDQTRLKAEVERLTGELGELEGIRSYLKWNGLQADLKDWLDWRSGRNGSEIPFPKDYLPPNP